MEQGLGGATKTEAKRLPSVVIVVACVALTVQAMVIVPTVLAAWWTTARVLAQFLEEPAEEQAAEQSTRRLRSRNVAIDGFLNSIEGLVVFGRIEEWDDGWRWVDPQRDLRSPYSYETARQAMFALFGVVVFEGGGGSIKALDVRRVTVHETDVGLVEEWPYPDRRSGWRWVEPQAGISGHIVFSTAEQAARHLAQVVPIGAALSSDELDEEGVVQVLQSMPLD